MFSSKIRHLGEVKLPEAHGIRIMMMPFKTEDVEGTLPEYLQHYVPLITTLCDFATGPHGVGYLTIDEALVRKGESHRRPGLHVDGIGPLKTAGGWASDPGGWGGSSYERGPWASEPGGWAAPTKTYRGGWAPEPGPWAGCGARTLPQYTMGGWSSTPAGAWARRGMVLVSSHYGCRGWAQDFEGYPGPNGVCEHLEDQLDPSSEIKMLANHAYWCDALAVHESMPMTEDTFRQLVRVSAPSDAPWYEGYTVNPLGILPGGPIHSPRSEFMAYRP